MGQSRDHLRTRDCLLGGGRKFALYSTHGDYEKTKEILDKLLPALTALIGSALGFYFGSKDKQT